MKKAIIVGASSGIGHDLAIILSKNDYKVGLLARREKEILDLKATNNEAFETAVFDVTAAEIEQKLFEMVSKLEGLDLLIITAGIGDINENLDIKIDINTISTNVLGFTKVAVWAFSFFQNQKHGHLVAISSIAGLRGSKNTTSYNATKAFQINYLEGLTQKAVASKLPIYISDIRAGLVQTAMAKGDGLFWVCPRDKAANQIYKGITTHKKILYVSKRWTIIAHILKMIPNWIYYRL